MNQRIYGDDLSNNEHPFTKRMKELVKNLNAVDDIVNKKQKSNVVIVVQSVSQLKTRMMTNLKKHHFSWCF